MSTTQHRSARHWAVAVALALLAIAFGWWWAQAPVADAVTGTSVTATEAAAGESGVSGQPTAAASAGLPVRVRRIDRPAAANPATPVVPLAQLPPLPPAEQPLAEAFETLEARARAGDVQAASRLAQDALCCSGMDMAASALDFMNRPQNAATDPQRAAQMATMRATAEQNLLKLRGYCGQSPMQRPPQLFDLALRAAELGDPVMTLELIGGRRLMGMLQQQAVAEYQRLGQFRERALDLLTRQVQQGNLDAVRLLAAGHASPGMHGALGGLLEADKQATLVYDLLYVRAGGQAYRGRFNAFIERNRQADPLTSGVDFAAAQQQAEQLYQQYFAHNTRRETGEPRMAMLEPDEGWQPAPAAIAAMRTCPAPPLSMNMPASAAPARAQGVGTP